MLQINKLQIAYGKTTIVRNFSIAVAQKEIVGIVGESGSGKSTVIRSILDLLGRGGKITQGEILFDGMEMKNRKGEAMRRMRGMEIAMIFQQPERSFDPIQTIESQFYECMRVHGKTSRQEARRIATELLTELYFPDPEGVLKAYPFELSGGMCQRVAIAIAMANQPKLLLADEPTSALDVTVQAQVVQIMMDMREKFGTSILLVTHNMGVIAYMVDTVGVMYHGQIVEWGKREEVLFDPKHPYTRQLMEAIPKMDGSLPVATEGKKAEVCCGEEGCLFRFRCKKARAECAERMPEKTFFSESHWALCRF